MRWLDWEDERGGKEKRNGGEMRIVVRRDGKRGRMKSRIVW